MKKFRDALAIIFFLIWIPLGLLLVIGILLVIAMNPLKMVQDMFSDSVGARGGFGPGGIEQFGSGESMPSKEMMEQMMQQGGPPAGFEDFKPPSN